MMKSKNKFLLILFLVFIILGLTIYYAQKEEKFQAKIQVSSASFLNCPAIKQASGKAPRVLSSEDKNSLRDRVRISTMQLKVKLKELKDKNDKNIFSDSSLRELLIQRKTDLLELFAIEPSLAVSSVFSAEEIKFWKNISVNCVEERSTDLSGTFEQISYDNFEKKISWDEYYLRGDNDFELRLHPAYPSHFRFSPQEKITIKGWKLDNEFLLFNAVKKEDKIGSKNPATAFAQSSPDNYILGDQKIAVILVKFPWTEEVATKEDVDKYIFGATNDYIEETSYHKAFLSGDTYGPYTLSIPKEEQCYVADNIKKAIEMAENVNFNNYQYVMVIAPFESCKFGSAAFDHNTYLKVAVVSKNGWGVIAHELGHNFGFSHSSFLNCEDKSINQGLNDCEIITYGDPYDVMGKGNSNFQYNAHHKEKAGWLTNSDISTVAKNGDYIIQPLEQFFGVRALKIPYTLYSGNDNYYIEYRQRINSDDNENYSDDFPYGGALIRLGLAGANLSLLLDPTLPPPSASESALLPNESFIDPQSGIQIVTKEKSANGLKMYVALNRKDYSPPEIKLSLEGAENMKDNGFGPVLSGTVKFIASASDKESGVKKVEFYDAYNNLISADYSVPYELSVNSLTVPNGVLNIYAIAYDNSDQEYPNLKISNVIYFEVENNDNINPSVSILEPKENEELINSATFTFSAKDNIGLNWGAIWYLTNNSTRSTITELIPIPAGINNPVKNITKSFAENNLDPGDYTFTMQVQDLAYNIAYASVNFIIKNPPVSRDSLIIPANPNLAIPELQKEQKAKEIYRNPGNIDPVPDKSGKINTAPAPKSSL